MGSLTTANNSVSIPSGQTLYMYGNILANSANSGSMTPTIMSYPTGLSQNVQSALISFTSSIASITNTLTDILFCFFISLIN